jgi:hypothetical protein
MTSPENVQLNWVRFWLWVQLVLGLFVVPFFFWQGVTTMEVTFWIGLALLAPATGMAAWRLFVEGEGKPQPSPPGSE